LNKSGTSEIFIYRNLANITSILGVLPLVVLFLNGGYQYIVPLIIFNNVMDDLDGVLAGKLNIRSRFGADLDNVCDAISHVVFVLAVGVHFGSLLLAASAIAAVSIILRVVARLDPQATGGGGSPTNELMRHILFTLLLAGQFNFGQEYILVAVFLIHSVSMQVPYSMPALIRMRAKSAMAIGLVNAALLAAWLVPIAAPVVTAAFLATYLYSFVWGWAEWRKS
jgi:phosphatidylserine synthase